MPSESQPATTDESVSHRPSRKVPIIVAVAVAATVVLGVLMVARAGARVNKVALAAQAKGVSTVVAIASSYSPTRKYVGTLLPWVEAKVGPQLISAYVGTVLVRPGDPVKRGQVIGTLDCRNASAASQGMSAQARAIEAQQVAVSHEAARIAELETGGFASANEIERKQADSASKQAELLSAKARLQRASLEVSDCVLRAPFDGEVSDRRMDPGAFAHPGDPIASVVDRSTIRVGADVPEGDFDLVGPGVKVDVHALALDAHLTGTIARRSPAADGSTRTVHFEVDLADPKRRLPVGTTAEITVAAGAPVEAVSIPLAAASVKGSKATVFVEENGHVRRLVVNVLGERLGRLFIDRKLSPGTLVVTEGRALLRDGDVVEAKPELAIGQTAVLSGVESVASSKARPER
jgi:membrane fusion protein, multidrug efflux system